MKQMKIVWRVSLIMIVLILLHGQSALAQSNEFLRFKLMSGLQIVFGTSPLPAQCLDF